MLSTPLQEYNPYSVRPQILSIFVIFLILAIISIIYYIKVKKLKQNQAPKGIVLLVQIYVEYVKSLIIEILGPEFLKITPYFLYLMSYIFLSNMIGIIGLENPTSSLTVTLSMGIITWIGTFVIAFKYQRLSYFKIFLIGAKIKNKKIYFLINPLEIISAITPVISISFRLWGNIFAGSLITTLWFYLWYYVTKSIPIIGLFNLLAAFTIAPIHMYFDLLCGTIQTLVFVLLTMVYWTLQKGEGEATQTKNVVEQTANLTATKITLLNNNQ